MIDYVFPNTYESEIMPSVLKFENTLDLSDLKEEEINMLALPVEEMLKLFDVFQEAANLDQNVEPQRSVTPVPDSEDENTSQKPRRFKQRFTKKFSNTGKENEPTPHPVVVNNNIEKKKPLKLVIKGKIIENKLPRLIMKIKGEAILLNKN